MSPRRTGRTFNFGAGGVCPGQTSYFWGLTSAGTMSKPGVATLYFSLGTPQSVPDRTP